jgi:hypothetical protein
VRAGRGSRASGFCSSTPGVIQSDTGEARCGSGSAGRRAAGQIRARRCRPHARLDRPAEPGPREPPLSITRGLFEWAPAEPGGLASPGVLLSGARVAPRSRPAARARGRVRAPPGDAGRRRPACRGYPCCGHGLDPTALTACPGQREQGAAPGTRADHLRPAGVASTAPGYPGIRAGRFPTSGGDALVRARSGRRPA